MAASPSNVKHSPTASPSINVNGTVSSVLIDGSSAGLEMEKQIVHLVQETGSINRGKVTIDTLPDYALLQIFTCCRQTQTKSPHFTLKAPASIQRTSLLGLMPQFFRPSQ